MNPTYDKYTVTQYSVNSILGSIESGEIAIPEIQRPFVWKGSQVRDLIDSLYNGYPTGYLIIWQNPTVRLKDGSSATGKKSPHRWSATHYSNYNCNCWSADFD